MTRRVVRERASCCPATPHWVRFASLASNTSRRLEKALVLEACPDLTSSIAGRLINRLSVSDETNMRDRPSANGVQRQGEHSPGAGSRLGAHHGVAGSRIEENSRDPIVAKHRRLPQRVENRFRRQLFGIDPGQSSTQARGAAMRVAIGRECESGAAVQWFVKEAAADGRCSCSIRTSAPDRPRRDARKA